MSDRDCRSSKRELLGNLHVGCVMSVADPRPGGQIEPLGCVRAFLAVGKPRRDGLVRKKMAFRSCWACRRSRRGWGSACSRLLY